MGKSAARLNLSQLIIVMVLPDSFSSALARWSLKAHLSNGRSLHLTILQWGW